MGPTPAGNIIIEVVSRAEGKDSGTIGE